VERRRAIPIAELMAGWRGPAEAAAQVLSSADGRWALVSTSVTALIAGSVAWLASGLMPDQHGYNGGRDRALMPYQLFLKLAGQNIGGPIAYAGLTPASVPDSTPTLSVAPASLDSELADERAGRDGNSETDTRTITLDRGETLVHALTEAGVSQADANAAILALARVYDPKAVRAGETFDIAFTSVPQQQIAQITYTPPSQSAEAMSDGDGSDNNTIEEVPETPVGKLLSLSYSPTVDHDITLSRGATGMFTAQDVHKKLEARYHRAGATIDSSLYLAAMQAGIPADVVVKMIHMFSYEVDFQRDLKPGNSFEVLYNYYYTPDGQPAKEGDIQYASLTLGGRTMALYRYKPDGEPADYFDSHGQSARSMLMKTPVDGARITSGFGMRFHPILGYSRMHKGVDFGVPIGTPVMAAGSGVVQQEGRLGGYGNFMKVDHQNGYSTAYGHLSRFAPGIHIGSRVRQGQVIAFSGNSGMSTGPHLHYEIRIHDNQVNPAVVKIATGTRLLGHDLRDFLVGRLHADTELASMPLENKVAEGGGELRAARD
jgi:murein DD-endopeptidase MepM/ murein hydrolase activator NlpD